MALCTSSAATPSCTAVGSYVDSNGNENMHRANCAAFAYGVNVVADWQTGPTALSETNAPNV